MDLAEAIRERRSIGLVKPDEVDQALIEQILNAAVYAPNHHITEPWRFFVMRGAGRSVLGNAYADIAGEHLDDPYSEANIAALKKHHDKALRAPVIIGVASEAADSAIIDRREEIAAVHAAVQNMLLQAHALGLGAVWRTGAPAYHPLMKEAFGLGDQHDIVGFIYLGHPTQTPAPRTPASFKAKTVWINESELSSY